jgi:hypothetical protein
LKIERAGALPGQARFVTSSKNLRLAKMTAWRDLRRSRACVRFESAIWPTACPAPGPTKDDDQYRYQDHQQIVKIELKRRLKPLELNELINQSHALFISKFLGNEARCERYEVGNRAQ